MARIDAEPRRISRRDFLKAAAASAGALGFSAIADRILVPTASAQTLQSQAIVESGKIHSSPEQQENISPSKFRGVMAWGNYRGKNEGERKSVIGFDTQGAKASGTASTWDGKVKKDFNDEREINATVDITNIDLKLSGKYDTHVVGYWNNRVSPENGPTFYFEINPQAPEEKRYTVRVLNTSGKEPRIYLQGKHVESKEFYNEFHGASVDVEIRTTDKDGRWNTVGGLFLGQNQASAEAFKAQNAEYLK